MVRLLRLLSVLSLILSISAAAAGGWRPRVDTPANLSFEQSSYDFGTQIVGTTIYRTLTITNSGDERAESMAAVLTGTGFGYRGGSYPGHGGNCSYRLGGGRDCRIVIAFSSNATGEFHGSLRMTYFNSVNTDSTTTQLTAGAIGKGEIVVTPNPVAFGNVVKNTTKSILVTLQNIGGTKVTSVKFGTFQTGFSAVGTNCSDKIQVAANCSVEIQFAPTTLADYSMTWQVKYDDGDSKKTLNVALSGSGINATDPNPPPVPDPPPPTPAPVTPAGPDASFGNSAWTTIEGLAGLVFARGVAMQADGKVLVVATDFNIGFQNMMVARLLANGQLDGSFGYDGRAWFSIYGMDDEANAIAVQSDGGIVVAGYGHNGSDMDLCVLRVNGEGLLDSTFNAGQGWNCLNLGNNESASSVRIQSDGKILAGGYSVSGLGEDYLVVRFNANGTLDTSFNGGSAVADFSMASDIGSALGLQSTGKILLAGTATVSGRRGLSAAAWSTAGGLDSTFGQGGYVYAQPSSLEGTGTSLMIRSDDSSVIGGQVEDGATTRFALVGMTSAGQPDSGFGSSGIVTTSFADGASYLGGLAALPGNLMIAAGHQTGGDGLNRVVMAAYKRDGTAETTQWTEGSFVWNMDDSVQRQLAGVIYDGENARLISVVTWMDDVSIKVGVGAYSYPTAP